MFAVESGFRQDSTWSPFIFDVLMTAFIVHLRLLDVSRHVNRQYVGCFLYAVDIILISSLIIGLQKMLVVYSATTKSYAFKFTYNKSHCLSLSKLANVDIGPMLFDNKSIAWFLSIKYLGVQLLSGKRLSFGKASTKGAFCFINFLSHYRGVGEIIQLSDYHQ